MIHTAIDENLSSGTLADIRNGLSWVRDHHHNAKPRLVRIPVDDFQKAVGKIVTMMMQPFAPTVCGLPCEPFERSRPAVVCVADDDTNLERESARTLEFSPVG